MTEPKPKPPLAPFVRGAVASLVAAERVVFLAIGILLFVAAFALLKQSVGILFLMIGGTSPAIAYGSQFLDVILLVLMVVELAYTVILSLRGSVLLAEPFLIVGLIAVIRRMLVITVGQVNDRSTGHENALELAILAAIVIVFVGSIVVLRSRPSVGFEDPDPLE